MNWETSTNRPCNTIKKEGKKKSFVSQVVRLTMPVWPPEALTGGQAPIPRTVSVFVIRGEWHAEWLIQFLVIQQRLKGVQAVADDDEGPDAAETMDFVMTPENFPQPKKDNGHIIIL